MIKEERFLPTIVPKPKVKKLSGRPKGSRDRDPVERLLTRRKMADREELIDAILYDTAKVLHATGQIPLGIGALMAGLGKLKASEPEGKGGMAELVSMLAEAAADGEEEEDAEVAEALADGEDSTE